VEVTYPACPAPGLVPFSPLGKGFFTGAIGADATFVSWDLRSRIPRFEPGALKVNLALVDLLGRIAWLLARKPWTTPIPDTTMSARLDETCVKLRMRRRRSKCRERGIPKNS
jgi:aryl-alcohol dehydrogenase-like predicted oxidoreductase